MDDKLLKQDQIYENFEKMIENEIASAAEYKKFLDKTTDLKFPIDFRQSYKQSETNLDNVFIDKYYNIDEVIDIIRKNKISSGKNYKKYNALDKKECGYTNNVYPVSFLPSASIRRTNSTSYLEQLESHFHQRVPSAFLQTQNAADLALKHPKQIRQIYKYRESYKLPKRLPSQAWKTIR